MPHVDRAVLEIADSILQAAGLLALLVVAICSLRSGTWRNPLEHRSAAAPPGAFVVLVFAFAAFVLLQNAGVQALGLTDEQLAPPGSPAFVQILAVISIGQLVLSTAVLFWLTIPRRAVTQSTLRVSRIRSTSAGLLGGLIAVPVTALQLAFVVTIWQALRPHEAPPTHVVLQGMQSQAGGPWGMAVLLISAVVAAPLFEEVCFRGLLLGGLIAVSGRPLLSVVISSAIFGLIHWSNPQTVLPLFTFGLLLAIVRTRYGLGAAFFAHALFNARTMAIALLNPEMIDAG